MGVVVPFTTIPEMFFRLAEKYATSERPVLMHKAEGGYVGIRYADLRRRVELFAAGLASLGVGKGDRVAIISENRPEWAVADIAITALGAVDAPIYPTNTAKQVEYILNDCGAKVAIVSNQFQLNKVLKVRGDTPALETTVLMAGKGGGAEDRGVVAFAKVLQAGEEYERAHPGMVRAAAEAVRPEDLLTLIYTSGTTGNPKGVMLTHHNLVSNILSGTQVLRVLEGDLFLSFLPLSHSFERMAGYYAALSCGGTIAYAESVETVPANLMEVRPNVVATVPRLFERIHARIMKQVDNSPPLRRKIFHWALAAGKEHAAAAKQGRVPAALAMRRALADRLVFRKIREKTGGNIRFMVSGGAPLPREFGEFFEAVGLRIIEGYGLTETSPVISVNPFDGYRFGTVGKVIPGVEVSIAPDGEILARGPNIMRGYWNNEAATREVIGEEGWFHTGDIGIMDAEGYLSITDRKKHLFVSSGGKNIAPQPIENLFLKSKYIEQFVLIGDRRMFLTALIVPDFESLKEFASRSGIQYTGPSDLAHRAEVYELLEKEIAGIQKDLANFERVRKFSVLDTPFTIEGGEITPSLKVRRKMVEEKYADRIERMYEGIA
jgi:long-chain acyl-CoA synthetase